MSDLDSVHQTVAIVLLGLLLVATYYDYTSAVLVLAAALIVVAIDGERRRRAHDSATSEDVDEGGKLATAELVTPEGTVTGLVRDADGEPVVLPDGDVDGLVCQFCGADGFESTDELEEHIDSHPYTTRRGETQ
jgi:hypothetical protein